MSGGGAGGGERPLAAADGASAPPVTAADGASARPVTAADGASARPLTAARDAPLGGQAVLEGVMMRGIGTWAVAVRRPAPEGAEDDLGEIVVRSFPLVTHARRRRVYRLPVIRGVVALVHSLSIGLRALGISANEQLADGEAPDQRADESPDGSGDAAGSVISGGAWVGTVVVSLAFAVGLFFVVPVSATNLIKHQLDSSLLFWLVEGALRTAIFLAYLALLSRVRDLRRVFEYHGAEHKVISCFEAGDELTPERASLYSRLHPRCGTSFLLVVMIMGIFVFALVGLPSLWILIVTRVLGVPLIAGLSFEVIKWAGRNRRRRWVQAIMYPGLQLQRLTTREPDLDQLAVSIAALQAVLAVETPGAATADELLGLEVVA